MAEISTPHGAGLAGPSTTLPRRLLGYAEAADFLGVRPSTLYSMVSRRRLPFIRINARHVKFDVDMLSAWLASKYVAPKEEEQS